MKESKDKPIKGRLISLNPGQKIVITPTRVACINTTGQKGGAGDSRKVRIEVNKAGPTKVAIVLLGIRDSNPESGKVIVISQVDISSRTK